MEECRAIQVRTCDLEYVIDEAWAGDPTLATKKMESLDGIPLLPLDPAIVSDSRRNHGAGPVVPPKARTDSQTAHRHSYTSSNTILVDLELPAYRKWVDSGTYPPNVDRPFDSRIQLVCTPEEMVDDETETDDSFDHRRNPSNATRILRSLRWRFCRHAKRCTASARSVSRTGVATETRRTNRSTRGAILLLIDVISFGEVVWSFVITQ